MRQAYVMGLIRQGWALGCWVGERLEKSPYFIRNGEISHEVPTDVVVGLVVDGYLASDGRVPLRHYNPTRRGRARFGFPTQPEHVTTDGETADQGSGEEE